MVLQDPQVLKTINTLDEKALGLSGEKMLFLRMTQSL